MNITFQWNQKPSPDEQELLETKTTEILQDRDINPCHPGAILVSLKISGPLDNKLQGSAKCQCGKKLMDFTGGPSASIQTITEYK